MRNHAKDIVSIDFFTVPTATFRVLYVLLVVSNARRVVAHFNVTTSPSAEWTSQQIFNAFPWDTAPRYLLRDRDGVYGQAFAPGSDVTPRNSRHGGRTLSSIP